MKKTLYTIVAAVLVNMQLNAQGCSDAGACSINSFRPATTTMSDSDGIMNTKNRIRVGFGFGKADNDITVMTQYLEYNRQVTNKIGIDAKLTSIAQRGNGIQAFGIGDLFLTGNYAFAKNIKAFLGAKIPTNSANVKLNGVALPMDYQSSLGTLDALLGVTYEIKKIQLMLGLQQPITQNNNTFYPNNFANTSPLRNFQYTNGFVRKGDILLRVAYPIGIGKNIQLTPSLLPIYHLQEDTYKDIFNNTKSIDGSAGLTLNANVFLNYTLSPKHALQLGFGMPLVVRDSRPDGLTRSVVANLEYAIKF